MSHARSVMETSIAAMNSPGESHACRKKNKRERSKLLPRHNREKYGVLKACGFIRAVSHRKQCPIFPERPGAGPCVRKLPARRGRNRMLLFIHDKVRNLLTAFIVNNKFPLRNLGPIAVILDLVGK